MNKDTYHTTYHTDFFRRADGYDHWRKGQMRYGDTLAAIGYALGWKNWEAIREQFPWLTPEGKETTDLTASQQLDVLHPKITRWPKRVLDVGGGRGEVTMAFRYFGIPVTAIEPHKDAKEWFEWTWGKVFNGLCRCGVEDGGYSLDNRMVEDTLDNELYLHNSDVDTVLLVETLEHLEKDTFDKFWAKTLKPLLTRNKGRLVITNWLGYHPLEATGNEHCRRTDDALYDWICEDGAIRYRRQSHIVVDYGI